MYLIRDLAILIEPYVPATASRIRAMLGLDSLTWADLARADGVPSVSRAEILFEQLPDETIAELRVRFSGSQAERAARAADSAAGENPPAAPEASPAERFRDTVELRAAKIVEIEQHPEADKLYIEKLDDGTEEGRTIVSGLVPHYAPEELLGRTIIVVANLKPAKLRGVKSHGMLLAASAPAGDDEDAGEIVDVLFVDHVEPGTRIVLDGYAPADPSESLKRIKIDDFFAIPIRAEDHQVSVDGVSLIAGDTPVRTTRVSAGDVG